MQIVGSTLWLLSTTERASTSRRFGHGGGAMVSAKRPVVLLAKGQGFRPYRLRTGNIMGLFKHDLSQIAVGHRVLR
jgi:hypothetical protein